MKRVLSVLLALCLVLGITPVMAGAWVTDDGFEISDASLILHNYTGPGGDIVVPSVEEIRYGAFDLRKPTLTSVDLSNCDRVRYLPDDAFKGCVNLTSVKLPPNITDLRYSVFENCTI